MKTKETKLYLWIKSIYRSKIFAVSLITCFSMVSINGMINYIDLLQKQETQVLVVNFTHPNLIEINLGKTNFNNKRLPIKNDSKHLKIHQEYLKILDNLIQSKNMKSKTNIIFLSERELTFPKESLNKQEPAQTLFDEEIRKKYCDSKSKTFVFKKVQPGKFHLEEAALKETNNYPKYVLGLSPVMTIFFARQDGKIISYKLPHIKPKTVNDFKKTIATISESFTGAIKKIKSDKKLLNTNEKLKHYKGNPNENLISFLVKNNKDNDLISVFNRINHYITLSALLEAEQNNFKRIIVFCIGYSNPNSFVGTTKNNLNYKKGNIKPNLTYDDTKVPPYVFKSILNGMFFLCNSCEETAKKKCVRCQTRYCSKECQIKDWPKHKKFCLKK